MQLFFDLTTSAQWGGHPVGIVRVERELARYALKARQDIRFCVHVREEGVFYEIDRELVGGIIEGERQILCRRKPPPSIAPVSFHRRIQRRARRALLDFPVVYGSLMRARGLKLTDEQITELRQWHPELPPSMRPPVLASYAEDVALRRMDLGPDIVLVSGGLDWEHKSVRALYALKKEHRFRYCAIVYDLIPILWPHYVVPAYVSILREYFGELMWLADYALCISACTEKDLLGFFDDFGTPRPRSAVFPLGCDIVEGKDLTPLPSQLAGKRYGLFVSTIEPRKNHRTVYEAFDRGMRAGTLSPERDRLVFVGRKGWAVEDLVQEIRTNPVTRDTIVMMEGVTDAQLARLYRDARFTIFPSHYEGYGLPVAEALAHGKACLMSARASLLEVDNEAAWRLDPKDVVEWARAMDAMFNDSERVKELEAGVARKFRRTDWADAGSDFFGKLQAMAMT